MDRNRQVIISLDLEPDYAGQIYPQRHCLWSNKIFRLLLLLIHTYNFHLNIFVVGTSLEKYPKLIKLLAKHPQITLYAHSYSHQLNQADTQEEIDQSVTAFEKVLNRHPNGYRAPEGRITLSGIKHLKAKDFKFDSSLFPTLLPKPKYFFTKNVFLKNDYLPEYPISTTQLLTPLSLSWSKLHGLHPRRGSSFLVYDFHLHDLFSCPCFHKLPIFWKCIYSVHKKSGLKLLVAFLEYCQYNHYQFISYPKTSE